MGQPPPVIIDPETGRENWRPYYGHLAPEVRVGRRGNSDRELMPDERMDEENAAAWLAANFQSLNKYTRDINIQVRGRGYLLDPDFSLSEDPDSVDKMLRDPIIQYATTYRRRLVCGREWFLEAKYERYKSFIDIYTDLLNRIENFLQARFTLAEAIFQGIAIARYNGTIDYLRLEGTDSYEYWWYPKTLEPIDKRRLRREYLITQQKDGTNQYAWAWTIYNPFQHAWFVIKNPNLYTWFVYNNDEDRMGHGRGLYDTLYPTWYAKTLLRQYGLEFAARFAEPWIDVAMSAEAGDTDALGTRGQAYINAIKTMRRGRVLYHDERDKMTLIDVTGSSQNHITKMREDLNTEIVLVCLSNTLTTGTGKFGSRGQAEVHENSQENSILFDRMLFEQAMTGGVLQEVWRHNRLNLFRLGIEDVPYECPLLFRLQKEQIYDIDEQAKIFDLGLKAGVPIRQRDFYERFDLPEPQPGEKILQAPTSDPFAGPSLGFDAMRAYQLLGRNTSTERWLANTANRGPGNFLGRQLDGMLL